MKKNGNKIVGTEVIGTITMNRHCCSGYNTHQGGYGAWKDKTGHDRNSKKAKREKVAIKNGTFE